MPTKKRKAKTEFDGVWIPKELYVIEELSWTEKILFTEICSLDKKNGCYASRENLGNFIGKSKMLVTKIISKLKRMKLVSENESLFNGRQRILHAHPENLKDLIVNKKIVSRVAKKESSRVTKNYYHSNTVSNTGNPISEDIGISNLEDCTTSPKNSFQDTSSKNPDRVSPEKSGKPLVQKKTKEDMLMDYWNTLPNVRHHTNPNTDTYRSAVRRIRQVLTGKLQTKTSLNAEWHKQCNIPDRYFTRKLPEALVKSNMRQLSDMATEGFHCPNGNGWIRKMGLADLIYNPNTGKSWFMWVAANGVRKISEVQDEKRAKRDPFRNEMVKSLSKALRDIRGKYVSGEYRGLENVITGIGGEREVWKGNGVWVQVHQHFPTLRSQVFDYSEWLVRKYEGKEDMRVGYLKVGGYAWDDYLKFTGESIGVQLMREGVMSDE